MKRGFAYWRVSSDQQKGNYSIPQQKKACLEYAIKEKVTIIKDFVDEAKSATADDRPAFIEMIEACERGEADVVIVYHTDRWARNEDDHFDYKRRLREAGVRLISITQQMIDDSPEGHLVDTVMAGINAYYSRDLSRKTKRGMLGRWESGWWPGWAPIGYINLDKEGKVSKKAYTIEKQRYFNELSRKQTLKRVEIDPIYGPLAKKAFRLYSSGDYSIAKLARFLSKEGLRNRKGEPVSHSVLHNMLTNSFYYGWMKWAGKEKKGKHEPLITKELFDICQYVAAKHRQFITRGRKHSFLLRGIVYCPLHKCKRKAPRGSRKKGLYYVDDYRRFTAEWHNKLNSTKRNKIGYYHCTNKEGCPTSYIEIDKLEKKVAKLIKKYQFSEDFIELVKSKVGDILNESHTDIKKQVKGLQNRKSNLEYKQSKLIDLLIDGDIPRDALKRKEDEYENRIKEIDEKIEELKSQSKIDRKIIEEVLYLTRDIYTTYNEAPDFLKKKYLRLFFERIYVKEGKIVKLVENPLFFTLREQQKVLTSTHLLQLKDLFCNQGMDFDIGLNDLSIFISLLTDQAVVDHPSDYQLATLKHHEVV